MIVRSIIPRPESMKSISLAARPEGSSPRSLPRISRWMFRCSHWFAPLGTGFPFWMSSATRNRFAIPPEGDCAACEAKKASPIFRIFSGPYR